MKTVVLLSGGMDSVTAFYEVAREHEIVAALSFDYGSKHNANEIPFAKLHAERAGIPFQVIKLDFINELFASDLLTSGGEIPDGHYAEENMIRTVVPFRNGIMLSVACGFAESLEAEALAIAAHSGDHAIYPDCREPFMQAMATAMKEGTYARIELLRPFIAMDKTAIAKRGHELGIDFAETWSCYKGGSTHCGTCGTCVERREAFQLAGITDPTSYLATPPIPKGPGDDPLITDH
ncbi:7-cyano-7-deazaguanine synthase QueC [Haloferula chungangensis]|uniref:7-cyano-7-deazaguanine synthase n=1 Tax=Haloferula chungangensis TaxID=1048331 RepID=A0ABW2LBT7_9BACT